MGVVIKIVIIGAAVIAVISLIPPLLEPILELIDSAFSTEFMQLVRNAYLVIPSNIKNLFYIGMSAIIISIIVRFSINEK